jgi:hypothetical protein
MLELSACFYLVSNWHCMAGLVFLGYGGFMFACGAPVGIATGLVARTPCKLATYTAIASTVSVVPAHVFSTLTFNGSEHSSDYMNGCNMVFRRMGNIGIFAGTISFALFAYGGKRTVCFLVKSIRSLKHLNK